MGCFGGGGSKQTQQNYLPWQEAGGKKLWETYSSKIGKGDPMADYPVDKLVAEMTPGQKSAISQAGGYLDLFGSVGKPVPLFGETGESLKGLLAGTTGAEYITPEATQNFWREYFVKPGQKALQENVLPAIRESFSGPGFWGSSRAKEQSEATQDLWDRLAEAKGELDWNSLLRNREVDEAKAQRALSAIGPALAYGAAPTEEALKKLGGVSAVYSLSAEEQQQKQRWLNAEMEKYKARFREMAPEDLEILMALLDRAYSSSAYSSWDPGLGYVGASSALSALGGGMGGNIASGKGLFG